MNNEEKDINETEIQVPNEEARLNENEAQAEAINSLEEDIIRNNTIPETSKDTPGSNGAFPVGAFDTSKD
jgi:hypothetical protein